MMWSIMHNRHTSVRMRPDSDPHSSGYAGIIAGHEYTVPPPSAGILGLFGVTDSLIFEARPEGWRREVESDQLIRRSLIERGDASMRGVWPPLNTLLPWNSVRWSIGAGSSQSLCFIAPDRP